MKDETLCGIFDSPIGRCGIAWTGEVVAALQLPERTDRETRARLARRFPAVRDVDPLRVAATAHAVGSIRDMLNGAADDLQSIALDWRGIPPFHRRVYEVSRTIRPGQTLTYGQVAALADAPEAARAVGHALGRNPFAIIVPCHRVLAAGGRMGGFSAPGGVDTKRRLLTLEGVVLSPAAEQLEAAL